jgi:hypothetical protein
VVTSRPPRTRRTRGKRWVLATAFLFATLIRAAAQEPLVAWTEVVPRAPTAGERFQLHIHVDAAPQAEIRVLGTIWPAGVRYVSGPTLRQESRPSLETVLSYTLEARRTGSYSLDGFLVRIDDEAIFTRSTTIQVVAGSARRTKPTARWVLSAVEAVVGESLGVDLIVTQYGALRLAELIETPAPRNAWLERYDSAKAIELSAATSGGGGPADAASVRYQVPVASFLLTPTRAGTLNLPVARIQLGSATGPTTTVFSEPASVGVLLAPAEAAATGAVGDFQFRNWLEEEATPAGHAITLHIEVSGTGNVRFVRLPEPETQGLPAGTSTRTEELTLSAEGYRGTVRVSYVFTGLSAGTYAIHVPEVVSYTPSAGVLRHHRGFDQKIEVAAPVTPRQQIADRGLPRPLNGNQLQVSCAPVATRGRSYLLLLPAPLLTLALLGRPRRRGDARNRRLQLRLPAVVVSAAALLVALVPSADVQHWAVAPLVDAGNAALNNGDLVAAEAAYRAAASRAECPGAMWYNLGLVATAADQTPSAIAWLRAASRANLAEVDTRAELRRIEAAAALSGQHGIAPFIHADLPFAGFITVYSLAVVVLGLLLRAGRVGWLITLILLTMIGAGLLATTVASVIHERQPLAVATSAILKRVPIDAASDWVALQPGTTLAVRGAHGEYDLVRTARGLDAWVRRGTTIPVVRN